MSEQTSTSEAKQEQPAENKPARRPVSDPREVAAVVMGRMKLVKTKRDELAIALDGLVDITQQLTRVYAQQLLTIEALRRRVRELEPPAATPAQLPARLQ